MLRTIPTALEYAQAFRRESEHEYPLVDAFEQRAGYAVDRARLLEAARVLACPVKANPPNWQHGRLIYAAWRRHFEGRTGAVLALDIGTAKGFSALCAEWARRDAGVLGKVVSVDVIDPRSRAPRNTVAEVTIPKTLTEVLAPFPEADGVRFLQGTGVDWLTAYRGRIEAAFVDGKHTADIVWKEGVLLADRQQRGDLVIFDDVHLPGIRSAVASLSAYSIDWLTILPTRVYAIARRV